MGDVFPEIRTRKQHVKDVLKVEEEAFNRTLDAGLQVFAGICGWHEELRSILPTLKRLDDWDHTRLAKGLLPVWPKLLKLRKTAASAVSKRSLSTLIHQAEQLLNEKEMGQIEEEIEQDAYPGRVDISTYEELKGPGGSLQTIQRAVETLSRRVELLSGEDAFKLYDTYGFPLDLTELMARERGLTVDVVGFNALMEEQKARARAAQKKTVIELSQIETKTPTRFLGYDALETPARVLEVVGLKDKTAVVLDTSTCYAEMGGQLGDTGELTGSGQLWRVVNTQKSGNTWLHFLGAAADFTLSPIAHSLSPDDAPAVGSTVTLNVDRARRSAIERHHTVTHLLHWALHEVVSKEASQKGSFVGPDKLTFDFNSAALTPAQVADIEELVNERIVENAGVSWTEVAHADVKNRKDVMQFFGDKYGDTVRVVQIGGGANKLDGYSMELCGGT
ncbi:MAG: hypothetical protein EB082_17100, partial [Verrucomicrobia bacterium]|nr:hypothetical protein [Verrucomicrobiota bacterium]